MVAVGTIITDRPPRTDPYERVYAYGSQRQTTWPSIDCPAQAVLGCLENVVVRVEEASRLDHS